MDCHTQQIQGEYQMNNYMAGGFEFPMPTGGIVPPMVRKSNQIYGRFEVLVSVGACHLGKLDSILGAMLKRRNFKVPNGGFRFFEFSRMIT